jgi:hypothetical protein
MTRVPFGQDCPYGEVFGITESPTHFVTALIAAAITGCGPATLEEVVDRTGYPSHSTMAARLERSGWIVCVGRTSTKAKLWQATPKAWRELGLVGWTFWDGPAVGLKAVR